MIGGSTGNATSSHFELDKTFKLETVGKTTSETMGEPINLSSGILGLLMGVASEIVCDNPVARGATIRVAIDRDNNEDSGEEKSSL